MLTEEMKRNHYSGLMGSHAAIIEGVNRWGDAHWLFNVLRGNISGELKETIPMMLGNQNEEVARKLYTEATGNKIRQIRRTLWHKNHKFIG